MKYAAIPFLLILSLLSIATDSTTTNSTTTEIRLSVEEYPPYVTQTKSHNGLLAIIVKEAFQSEGITVVLDFFPGKRAYHLAQRGEYDGSFPWAERPERHHHFYYGEPLIEADDEVFFFNKGTSINWNAKAQDYRSIQGSSIVTILGYNYGEKFQSAEKTQLIDVYRVPDLEQALRILLSKRVDFLISPERVARFSLTSMFPEKSHNIESVLAIDEPKEMDYLIISKKSKQGIYFKDALDRGLQRLKKSGRYQEIIEQFSY